MKNFKIANYRPIVLSAICLALGIFVGALTGISRVGFFIALALLVVGFILSLFLKFSSLRIATIFLLIGFIAISVVGFVKQTPYVAYDSTYLEGRVKEVSLANKETNRYVIEDATILGDEVAGLVTVDCEAVFEVGDRVGVSGSFSTIEYNPFNSYSVSKYIENVKYKMSDCTGQKIGETPLSLVELVRVKIVKTYVERMGPDEGGVALGLVLGDTSYIDYDTATDMSMSGLSHLFSVSGLHVGFMSVLVFLVLRLFRVSKQKSLIWVVAVLFTYGLLTGFPVGVIRASIMSVLMLYSEIKKQRYDQLNGLATATIILLLINPLELFSVSFLLSIGAVFGIVCFLWSFRNLYTGDKFIVKTLVSSVGVSISANVFVLPIASYYFGRISLYFVLANIIVVPIASLLYSLLVPITTLSILIEPIGILLTPFSIPIVGINAISTFVANLPFSTLQIEAPMLSSLLLSFGAVVLSKFYMGSKYSKIVLFSLSFLACALIFFLF